MSAIVRTVVVTVQVTLFGGAEAAVDAGVTAAQPQAKEFDAVGAKLVFGLQVILCGLYYVGVFGLLAIAAGQHGGLTFAPFAEPAHPLYPMATADPKDVLDIGAAGRLIHLVLLLTVLTGGLTALILSVAGVIVVKQLKENGHPWFRRVLAATILTGLLAVMQFTPFGIDVFRWMMD